MERSSCVSLSREWEKREPHRGSKGHGDILHIRWGKSESLTLGQPENSSGSAVVPGDIRRSPLFSEKLGGAAWGLMVWPETKKPARTPRKTLPW